MSSLWPEADIVRASDHFRAGITPATTRELSDYDRIVVDISENVAAVGFLIGAAIAVGTDLLLTQPIGTSVASLAGLPSLSYDADTLDRPEGVERFRFGLETLSSSVTPPAGERVFISYSHSDRSHLTRLLVHLRPLERQQKVAIWEDSRIRAGADWKAEIEAEISNCSIAVLLISADFLASDFIVSNELPAILAGAQDRGVTILSLILKPCRFERTPEMARFQAVNSPSEPLVSCDEGRREEIFDQIAAAVEAKLQG